MPPGPVRRKDFLKVLKYLGLRHLRSEGGHMVFGKKGLTRPVIIRSTGDIPLFHVKTNCITLGISLKEFFEIVAKKGKKKK